MKWDCQRPAKAAVERCRGGASTSPPQGAGVLPSHIPTDHCAGARTSRRAVGRISASRKTHFVWVPLKMGSRACERAGARTPPLAELLAEVRARAAPTLPGPLASPPHTLSDH